MNAGFLLFTALFGVAALLLIGALLLSRRRSPRAAGDQREHAVWVLGAAALSLAFLSLLILVMR